MKNSADLGGCYPPRPSASVDNTLLDLQNSSYPTQPHSIIAKYTMAFLYSDRLYFLWRGINKCTVRNATKEVTRAAVVSVLFLTVENKNALSKFTSAHLVREPVAFQMEFAIS